MSFQGFPSEYTVLVASKNICLSHICWLIIFTTLSLLQNLIATEPGIQSITGFIVFDTREKKSYEPLLDVEVCYYWHWFCISYTSSKMQCFNYTFLDLIWWCLQLCFYVLQIFVQMDWTSWLVHPTWTDDDK